MGLCGRPSLDLESMGLLWMKPLSLDMIVGEEDSSELQRGRVHSCDNSPLPSFDASWARWLRAEERLMDFPLG